MYIAIAYYLVVVIIIGLIVFFVSGFSIFIGVIATFRNEEESSSSDEKYETK